MIRAYPQLLQAYNDALPTAGAQQLSDMPRGSGSNRSVENAAIKLSNEHREYAAVRNTIDYTQTLATGDTRMELIELFYWKKQYKRLEDVAQAVHISYRTARRYNSEFIHMVGYNLDLI